MGRLSSYPLATTAAGAALVGVQGGSTKRIPAELLSGNAFLFPAIEGEDIGPALNAFMAARSPGGAGADGGVVILPKGNFLSSVQLVIPNKVALRGAGKRATIVKAAPAFPTSTALCRLGSAAAQYSFDCFAADLTLDCDGKAGSIGLLCTNSQEGSGFRSLNISNFRDIGLYLQGPGNANMYGEDLEVYSTNYAANACVKISEAAQTMFNKITVYGKGIGQCAAGVHLYNTQVDGSGWHLEGATAGIYIEGNNVSGSITGIDASGGVTNVTNLVHVNGGELKIGLYDITKRGATTTIRHDFFAMSINDSFIPNALAMTAFHRGEASLTVGASPYTYRNETPTHQRVTIVGGTVSLVEFCRQADSNAGAVAGAFMVAPGERLRVTYSVAPVMRRYAM